MTSLQLVAIFLMMAVELWAYVKDASVKGKVDCSGAFVYAFRQYGLTIAHGSNSIWRLHLSEKGKIGSIELVPGMPVFKNQMDGKEPEKYQNDGIGNMYHIGCYIGPTVDYPEGAVVHAKGEKFGIVTDSIKDGWTHAGRLKQVRYIEKEEDAQAGTAIVVAESGSTVNLRKAPDSQVVIFRVPIGASVDVLSQSGDWAKVRYTGNDGAYIGWMMVKFLNFGETKGPVSGDLYEKGMDLYKRLGELQAELGEMFGLHG